MPQPHGIPTRYNGTLYRSRIEATWAHMFDQLHWPHEYEPIDLNGYIPDFILTFPHAPILAEVKSDLYLKDLAKHHEKIEASGWENEAIILGGTWQLRDTTSTRYFANHGTPGHAYPTNDNEWHWSPSSLHHCTECHNVSFHHLHGVWNCRVCGRYDGDHYLESIDPNHINQMWKKAREATRWTP